MELYLLDREHKMKMFKKSQISVELLYAVGVIILVFLLLVGITFNYRQDIRRSDEFLTMRGECFEVSDTIASVSAAGMNTERIITIDNRVKILDDGRILVGGADLTSLDFDNAKAICTYTGTIAEIELSRGDYNFLNTGVIVQVINVGLDSPEGGESGSCGENCVLSPCGEYEWSGNCIEGSGGCEVEGDECAPLYCECVPSGLPPADD